MEPEQVHHTAPQKRSWNTTAEDLAAATGPAAKTQAVAIYGSVSTADIAASIKAYLSTKASEGNEDAARVVLGPEDITIVRKEGSEAVETDRIKTLGSFEVDITSKGGEAVRRTVRVKAQD